MAKKRFLNHVTIIKMPSKDYLIARAKLADQLVLALGEAERIAMATKNVFLAIALKTAKAGVYAPEVEWELLAKTLSGLRDRIAKAKGFTELLVIVGEIFEYKIDPNWNIAGITEEDREVMRTHLGTVVSFSQVLLAAIEAETPKH